MTKKSIIEQLSDTKLKPAYSMLSVVAICSTMIVGLVVFNKHDSISQSQETKRLANTEMLAHEIQIRKSVLQEVEIIAATRQAQALAATNPFALEAAKNKECNGVSLTINGEDYSIEPVKVNGTNYTSEQKKLLTIAYQIGLEVGLPETIQALLLQETVAGAIGNRIGDISLAVGKRSYGIMQVKVATAKGVIKHYPELVSQYFPGRKSLRKIRNEEVMIKLIQDDVFSIKVATLNFILGRKKTKSWAAAVVAYNTGLGKARRLENPKQHKYYRKVVARIIEEVRPFNTKLGFNKIK